jgi:hypothetical protein
VLKRLLYRTHAAVYRLDGWFKQRFTTAGRLLVGLLVLAGVFGVNVHANLAYQLATLAMGLLGLAMLSALWFRCGVSIRRRLPRYASDGDTLHYVVEVENHSRRVQRGLLLQEQVRSSSTVATGDDPPARLHQLGRRAAPACRRPSAAGSGAGPTARWAGRSAHRVAAVSPRLRTPCRLHVAAAGPPGPVLRAQSHSASRVAAGITEALRGELERLDR